jgi:hypothetical protein
MITIQQLFIAAACLVGLVLLAVFTAAWGWFFYRLWRSLQDFIAAVGELGKVAESFSQLPKLIEGHQRIAQASVVEITRLRKCVSKIEKLFVAPDPEKSGGLIEHNEEEADKAFSIRELLESHPEYDRIQAEQMIENSFQNDKLGVE